MVPLCSILEYLTVYVVVLFDLIEGLNETLKVYFGNIA